MKFKFYQVQHLLKTVFFFFLLFITCSPIFAQLKVVGRVIDATTKETIGGVTISVKGTKISVASGIDGSFSIKTEKKSILEFSSVGYLNTSFDVTNANMGTVEMISSQTTLKEVIITNNQAIDRKTPVAVSTLKALQIEEFSGNRGFPELLESTPSVYVTNDGGGYGDSKLNIRGFSQENISVMINGVPVNDMENGRVFWSNWSGIREIASNVQVQRGLGASKLSIAAVGGNVNIVTKATEMRPGTTISSSLGNNGHIATSVGFSTGKQKSGFAFSLLASRTSGNGYIEGTAFEVYNYFATMAYEINKKSTITATVTGAPQWHNQGFNQRYQTLFGNPNDPKVINRGNKYNNSWGYYNGEEFSFNKNFYHKPIANINYYLKLDRRTDISAVLYGSLGRGGGTGPLGSINGISGFSLTDESGQIRFDDIDKWNRGGSVAGFGAVNTVWTDSSYKGKYIVNGTIGSSKGIVRRSNMNEHNWYGAIINLTHKTTNNYSIDAGIDLRTYKGLHYRRVEDALGADGYFEKYVGATNADYNNQLRYVDAGDKKTRIGYNYDGLVNQYGGYLSSSYEKDKLTAFVALTASNTSYQRVDYFHYAPDSSNRKSAIKNFLGFVTKGGFSYRFNRQHFAFANVGYFERAPFFGSVFAANDNTTLTNNLAKEKILGIEAGYGFRSPYISANFNIYQTQWKDKFLLRSFNNPADGLTYNTNIPGLIAEHRGVEFDANIHPLRKLDITAMASLGDWKWKNNSVGITYDNAGNPIGKATTYYTEGLKVGGTAQSSFALGAGYELFRGFRLRLNYRYLSNIYATFSPNSTARTDSSSAGRQAWKLPAFGLLNSAATYSFKAQNTRITLRLNVDNLFNKIYIQTSNTDVVYNPNDKTDFLIGDNGSGKNNSVHPGFGRTWIFTVKFQL